MEHAVCHVVRRDSSAVKFDSVEIAFLKLYLYGLKLLSDERGGGPEYPEKTPDDELQKMPHTKASKIEAPSETRTLKIALVTG